MPSPWSSSSVLFCTSGTVPYRDSCVLVMVVCIVYMDFHMIMCVYLCMYVLIRCCLSILDGGFVAAARFVHRIDSTFSISGALVDVNLPLLYSILEIPSLSTDQPNPTLLRYSEGI